MGQHILTDQEVLSDIIEAAELNEGDRIVEIGAGTGALTAMAAPRVAHLTALEVDKGMCWRLRQRLGSASNINIIKTDALTFDYGSLQAPFKIIGNLPYYMATPLLMRLIYHKKLITDMTLMFQKEVADRLAASPGNKDYGALTIKVQYHVEVTKCFEVPPDAFRPPPKVKSALVKLRFREQPPVSPRDPQSFFSLVEAAFAHRRKTLTNSLMGAFNHPPGKRIIQLALEEMGVDPRSRGETLSMDDFAKLSDRLTDLTGTMLQAESGDEQ